MSQHWLGQPWPDIGFPSAARRSELIETAPRDDAGQERTRIVHPCAVGPVPAQIGLLNRVFRLGERAQHTICQRHQVAPMRFEAGSWVAWFGRGHAACRRTGVTVPPTVTR